MRGPKECQWDRGSTQASVATGGGGGSVTETGALFPRLHVKETKRVGPRAPPRNKMALYEQFTFPSSRYVPPSLPLPAPKTPTTYGPQRPSYEGPPPAFGGMPWMPWMPYSEMYTGSYFGGQPSVNASNSSTVVDCEGDLRQTGVPAADSGRPSSNSASHMSPWVSSHSNVKSVSSKKARSNNDRTVPTGAPPVASSHGPSIPVGGLNQLAAREGHPDKADTASTTEPASASSVRHGEASGFATSRTNGGTHFIYGDPEGSKIADQYRKGGNQGDEDESELMESTVFEKERDSVTMLKNDPGHTDSHHSVVQRKKRSEANVSSDVNGIDGRNSSDESLTGIEEDKRGRLSKIVHNSNNPSGSQAIVSALSTPTAGETVIVDDRTRDIGEQGSKNEIYESDRKSMSSAGSGDDLEITSGAQNSEVSESDERLSDRGESDAVDAGDASVAGTDLGRIRHKIAPKDIVNAIGEQEFWRARKLILRYRVSVSAVEDALVNEKLMSGSEAFTSKVGRQQKIFSAQLFELHRILKVQQLLASLPTVEDMITSTPEAPVETSNRAEANDSQDVDKTFKNTETFAGNQGRQEDNAGKQPDSSGHSSTSDRLCAEHPLGNSETGQSEAGQEPAMFNITPGASTASWGGVPYAKAGTNEWFGAVPGPNGAYMYHPYPGSFNASQVSNMGAYNGAYPVMCAPNAMEVPSMTPYGVPRYEQQPNLMHYMYSYNSYQQQQWPTAVFCPPHPANPGSSWGGVPQPLPYMNPALRGPYGWCNDPAAALHPSGPSNFVRPSPQSNAQSMPAGFHPNPFPTHSPWAGTSSNQQAGSEAEIFQQQGRWSLSSETGQTGTPVFQKPHRYASDQDCVQAGSQKDQGGAPFSGCETFAVSSRKPLVDSSSQDREGSLPHYAESGPNAGWRRSDGSFLRDTCGDQIEGFAADYYGYADKPENVLKRGRGNRPEVEGLGDKNGARQYFDSRKAPDSQMDALPLFPLGPVLKGLEIGRPGSHSSSGVIKAVPRAMVASAESTAGILSSIQSQRQQ